MKTLSAYGKGNFEIGKNAGIRNVKSFVKTCKPSPE
jgi:hypothetical protein